MVLADGSFVTASENENADLFWALRGGGNFGVVTSFEYQLHPVEHVVAGPMFWPIEDLEETMRWYREWQPQTPEDVYAYYLTAEVPGTWARCLRQSLSRWHSSPGSISSGHR